MNIFKRLFKKNKPFDQDDYSKTATEMQQMIDKKFKKGFPKGAIVTVDKTFSNSGQVILTPSALKFDKDGRYRVKEINKFPKLTKSELIALESCIQFTLAGAKAIGVEPNLRKAITMKALTDKGYLVRIKKGHYKLSFYK